MNQEFGRNQSHNEIEKSQASGICDLLKAFKILFTSERHSCIRISPRNAKNKANQLIIGIIQIGE
jgi:hypothetical protein